MRRSLSAAAVLVPLGLLCLTGCGDTEQTTRGPDPTATSTPSSPADASGDASGDSGTAEDADYDVRLLHRTAAGGTASTTLVRVPDAAALTTVLEPISSPELAADVQDAVRVGRPEVGEAGGVLAGVVAVGCDVPDEVEVEPGGSLDDWTVVAPEEGSDQECFAPVTTVAVVTVRG